MQNYHPFASKVVIPVTEVLVYYSFLNEKLIESEKSITRKLALLYRLGNEEDYEKLHHSYNYDYKYLGTKYFSYSFIIQGYIAIENGLKLLCNEIKEDKSLPLGISAIRGTLSQRVNKFFIAFKLHGFSSANKKQLEDFTTIRNNLVHQAGEVKSNPKDDQEIKKIIQKNKYLNIKAGRLDIDYKYCENKLGYFRNMLDNFCKENDYFLSEPTKIAGRRHTL